MNVDAFERLSVVQAKERMMVGEDCQKFIDCATKDRSGNLKIEIVGNIMNVDINFSSSLDAGKHLRKFLKVLRFTMVRFRREKDDSRKFIISLDDTPGKVLEVRYNILKSE